MDPIADFLTRIRNANMKKKEKVDIPFSKIKTEIINLDHLINEYENNFLSLYNELFSFSFYWKSEFSDDFFDVKQKEKLALKEFIDELKSYKDVFSFISMKYGSHGEKIFFDLEKLDTTYSKICSFYVSLQKLVDEINLLGASNPKIKPFLDFDINRFKNDLVLFGDFKKNYLEKINMIKENEKEIRYRLSKIDFSRINPALFIEGSAS